MTQTAQATQIISNENDWKSIRDKKIGGSELATIMGLNLKWSSPYDLWLQKTGRAPKFEGNIHTQRGHHIESAVVSWFEDESEQRVIKRSDSLEYVTHPIYDFIGGSPDRRYFSRNRGKGTLEAKSTLAQIDPDDIPAGWLLQPNYYSGLLGYNFNAIAWISGRMDFDWREFEFNQELFDNSIKAAVHFWTEYVEKDVAPPPMSGADIQAMYPQHEIDKMIEATPELVEIYEELVKLTGSIKEKEARKTELVEAVKLTFGTHERANHGDKVLFTFKAPKEGKKLNTKRFKAEDPETFAKYYDVNQGSRRFLVK